jgi:hypothetical protein
MCLIIQYTNITSKKVCRSGSGGMARTGTCAINFKLGDSRPSSPALSFSAGKSYRSAVASCTSPSSYTMDKGDSGLKTIQCVYCDRPSGLYVPSSQCNHIGIGGQHAHRRTFRSQITGHRLFVHKHQRLGRRNERAFRFRRFFAEDFLVVVVHE